MILIIALHILVCGFLILVVLLQSGKAGDLASTFGGAGSQTAFGTRSATTLLTKLTAVSAALFMVTCLILAGWAQRGESSVMEGAATSTAPAETAPDSTGQETGGETAEEPVESEPGAPPAEEGSGEPGKSPTGGN